MFIVATVPKSESKQPVYMGRQNGLSYSRIIYSNKNEWIAHRLLHVWVSKTNNMRYGRRGSVDKISCCASIRNWVWILAISKTKQNNKKQKPTWFDWVCLEPQCWERWRQENHELSPTCLQIQRDLVLRIRQKIIEQGPMSSSDLCVCIYSCEHVYTHVSIY